MSERGSLAPFLLSLTAPSRTADDSSDRYSVVSAISMMYAIARPRSHCQRSPASSLVSGLVSVAGLGGASGLAAIAALRSLWAIHYPPVSIRSPGLVQQFGQPCAQHRSGLTLGLSD
jgi:hypothetical protein